MSRSKLIDQTYKNIKASKLLHAPWISKEDCEFIVDAFIDSMADSIVDGDKIILKNFLTMEVVDRAERKGRDPKTDSVITYPAYKAVNCRVSKTIKDALNNRL